MSSKAKNRLNSKSIAQGVASRSLVYRLELLAVGAEQKNTVCLTKDGRAYLSEALGDLKGEEEFDFFQKTIRRMEKKFKINPRLVVYDLHPEYLNTKYALALRIPRLGVQHHYAHIASCIAENGISGKVIGVAFDGTGFGLDGRIWGGEFLLASLAGFERVGHLSYTPMPGGDMSVKEPWRMAISFLYSAYGKRIFDLDLALFCRCRKRKTKIITEMIKEKINSPLSSSCGRLFDAVASLLGISDKAEYEAQGPIELEKISDNRINSRYPYEIIKKDGMLLIDPCPIIRAVVRDLKRKKPLSQIGGKFHNTLAEASIELICGIRKKRKINKVVLSGGVFQNRLLLEKMVAGLKKAKFRVFTHTLTPANDSGISLGQAAVGIRYLKRKCA